MRFSLNTWLKLKTEPVLFYSQGGLNQSVSNQASPLHQPYIPSQFPRRSLRKTRASCDELDNSCVLSEASAATLDIMDRGTPMLLLQYEVLYNY